MILQEMRAKALRNELDAASHGNRLLTRQVKELEEENAVLRSTLIRFQRVLRSQRSRTRTDGTSTVSRDPAKDRRRSALDGIQEEGDSLLRGRGNREARVSGGQNTGVAPERRETLGGTRPGGPHGTSGGQSAADGPGWRETLQGTRPGGALGTAKEDAGSNGCSDCGGEAGGVWSAREGPGHPEGPSYRVALEGAALSDECAVTAVAVVSARFPVCGTAGNPHGGPDRPLREGDQGTGDQLSASVLVKARYCGPHVSGLQLPKQAHPVPPLLRPAVPLLGLADAKRVSRTFDNYLRSEGLCKSCEFEPLQLPGRARGIPVGPPGLLPAEVSHTSAAPPRLPEQAPGAAAVFPNQAQEGCPGQDHKARTGGPQGLCTALPHGAESPNRTAGVQRGSLDGALEGGSLHCAEGFADAPSTSGAPLRIACNVGGQALPYQALQCADASLQGGPERDHASADCRPAWDCQMYQSSVPQVPDQARMLPTQETPSAGHPLPFPLDDGADCIGARYGLPAVASARRDVEELLDQYALEAPDGQLQVQSSDPKGACSGPRRRGSHVQGPQSGSVSSYISSIGCGTLHMNVLFDANDGGNGFDDALKPLIL